MKNNPPGENARAWFELVIPTHAERVDLMTGALAAWGIAGSEVREPRRGAAEVVVYVEAADLQGARAQAERIAAALPGIDFGDVEVRPSVAERVWTENWRQHFPPMRIGRRLTVVPPWEAAREPDRLTLVINPGGAFGTGKHETTALCLAAIEDLVAPGDRVADVGCGSGILAIAAAKLGAVDVLATDVDPAAIEATRENAEANGVARFITARLVTATATDTLAQRRFDLIVANIYADTLVAICGELGSALAAGGRLVLSGIESARTTIVEDALRTRGFALKARLTAGEWAALVFDRPTA